MEIIDSVFTFLLGVAIVVLLILRRKDLKAADWTIVLLAAVSAAASLASMRIRSLVLVAIVFAPLFAIGGYGVAFYLRSRESDWLWWSIGIFLVTTFLFAMGLYAWSRGA